LAGEILSAQVSARMVNRHDLVFRSGSSYWMAASATAQGQSNGLGVDARLQGTRVVQPNALMHWLRVRRLCRTR
jgi:hypothetical protein